MSNLASELTSVPSQTPASLIDLLARTSLQDRTAFAALYNATSLKLFGVILRILKRKQAAEDVLQDTYVKIWEKAGDFDATLGAAITWMATIARNRALDEVRRRPNLVSAEDIMGFDNIAADDISAIDQMVSDEDYKRLANCLNGLEREKRDMILLAYHHGMSRDMLAQRFGHPVATIKTWLRRSLGSLKQCLDS